MSPWTLILSAQFTEYFANTRPIEVDRISQQPLPDCPARGGARHVNSLATKVSHGIHMRVGGAPFLLTH